MNTAYARKHWIARPTALLLATSLAGPLLAGCGGGKPSGASAPPIDDTAGGMRSVPSAPAPPQNTGMSTKKKLVLLAGAAALFYLYKKHQNAKGVGEQGQYYQSKNGRIYYRDAQGTAHWVTPPPGGIQVPEDEASQYSGYKGYNGQNSGNDFGNATGGG